MGRFPRITRLVGVAIALAIALAACVTANNIDDAQVDTRPYIVTVAGDSYAGGQGLDPIDAGPCKLSNESVGGLLRTKLIRGRAPSVNIVACADAKIENIAATPQPGADGLQIDRVRPDADAVIMTIGGNDLTFGDLSKDCLFGDKCAAAVDTARQHLYTKMSPPDGSGTLDAMVRRVQERAPHAKIIVLGYPHITGGKACVDLTVPGTNLLIEPDESTLLDGLQGEVDQVYAEMAERTGITFLPANNFIDHDACSNDPYVNGYLGLTDPKTLHLTAAGQRAYLDLVLTEL